MTDTFETINQALYLTAKFPDVDRELIELAFSPRQAPRLSPREFSRIKTRYGISENSNKLLEFVGDSFLKTLTIRRLLDLYMLHLTPAQYHKITQEFVSNINLTELSGELGLCETLFPGWALSGPRGGSRGSGRTPGAGGHADWHNPCSNSIEAVIAALYVQYQDFDKIYKWFFSVPAIVDNFHGHVRAVTGKSPNRFTEPVTPAPAPAPRLSPVSSPIPIPKLKLVLPVTTAKTVTTAKPKMELILPPPRAIFKVYRVSDKPYAEFGVLPRSFKLTDGKYVVSYFGFPTFSKFKLGKLDVFSAISKINKETEIKYTAGRVPMFSDHIPGGGWGYYDVFEGIVTVYSALAPDEATFNIIKVALAYEVVNRHDDSYEAPFTNYDLETVPVSFDPSRFLLHVDVTSIKPATTMDIKTKHKTFDIDPQPIIDRWDTSYLTAGAPALTSTDDLFNFVVKDPGRVLRLFYGKFNLFLGPPYYPYGFGLRFVENGVVGEVPMTFLGLLVGEDQHERKMKEHMPMLLVQLVDHLSQMGIHVPLTDDLKQIYAPYDTTKYLKE